MKFRLRLQLIVLSGLLGLGWTLQSLVAPTPFVNCLRGDILPLDSLYEGNNGSFASAGTCDHCHGFDSNGLASVDLEGGDVNVVDDWRSSMMANSAKDPYWRAKVSEEVNHFPQHQGAIENTCTKCHAPMGHYDALFDGAANYSISDMLADPVALDGVSCLACHQQLPQTENAQHTGHLFYDSSPHAYGPYEGPLVTPMALYSGYTPEHGSHIVDAKLCAGCHSLVTETVDDNGELTGNLFVEQATWHEWLNSSYSENGTTCQSCHLPPLPKQSVVLAAGYDTPGRTPYGLHFLTGGNTTMLRILRDNKETLGISASTSGFDATIANTVENLTQRSLQVQVLETNRTADTVYIDVLLRNTTGHKLPSGYPSRRMSVHLSCEDANGNVTFQSGGFDALHQIAGESLPYEPHHQRITSSDQVQIYEMVMGDVNGSKTNVLNSAASHLKDNRLVPLGFGYEGTLYDTTEVVLGLDDPDFNFMPAAGSGTDVIHYAIPTNGLTAAWTAQIEVYFQAVPPHWINSLLETSTPEIEAFSGMLQDADMSPQLMRSATVSIPAFVGIAEQTNQPVWHQFSGSQLLLRSHTAGSYAIYSINGQLQKEGALWPNQNAEHHLSSAGEYLVVCKLKNGQQQIIRIMVTNANY
jgi:Cytochrome c554 and c-prime